MKSKEIAERLEKEPFTDVFSDVRREAAAHILEQEAEILEQCRLNGMGAERELKLITERDQARDALRVCVVALEDSARTMLAWSVACQDGVVKRCQCKKCVTKRSEAAIKQASEVLK